MSIRNLTLAVSVCLASSVAALAQPGTDYVFQLPGQGSSSAQIAGYPYTASPLTPSISTLGPNGTYNIVAKPDGSGYYVLGQTLQIANSAFTSFTTVNGISGVPTAAAASADGNYVAVAAGQLYVISASTGQIVSTNSTGGTLVGVAISEDSKYVYALTNSPGTSIVTQYNLATGAKVNTLSFAGAGNPTSIAISPAGLLYVGATNRVWEINPISLTVTPTGTMTPNATPGPFRFTPDGTTLYFVNTTASTTGGQIIQITLATYGIASYPPTSGGGQTPLDDVLIAGNGRIFAVQYASSTIYDVNPSPLSLATSSLNSVINTQAVVGAALSSEVPSALYLYLLESGSSQDVLYRINLASNQIGAQGPAASNTGTLQFVAVPPQTGASSFITYNINQTVAQGAVSLPLVARVLDQSGRPVFNLPVSFTTPANDGIIINTPTPTTDANGYVQTTIVAPAVEGTYSVTLTAGTANTSYTINVPGAGGSSGTGTGGISQVSIVTGNGQLVQEGSNTGGGGSGDALTILVTDVNGVPLQDTPVTFAVTSGTGNLARSYDSNGNTNDIEQADGTVTSVTDSNGLAEVNFVAQLPANGFDYETDTVTATTAYGVVGFQEISYAIYIQGTTYAAFPPQVTLLTPTIANNYMVTVAEGSATANAITAQILANTSSQQCPNFQSNLGGSGYAGCPIPGVSIRLTQPSTGNFASATASTVASCSGQALSDQNGNASCNIVATCGVAPGAYGIVFAIGDYHFQTGTVVITQGVAQLLSIISGNNQSGTAGQAAVQPLVATVTDSCGNVSPGAHVSWAVTQGSATLSNVVSTSGSSGHVSANLTFGATAGSVTVTVSLGTSSVATFTLTSQASASSMTIVSGNSQSATVSNAFALPLTVLVKDGSGNPVAGANVGFAVTSGNATLTPSSAVTSTGGTASTTVTAGPNPGNIVVTASYASVSTTFTLVAVAVGPVITAANFQNAASFQTGLVPCGLATATGSDIAAGITGTVSGSSFLSPLMYTLNGLSLTVNGVPAPVYQLTNSNGKQQVTFQTPCEVTPTTNGTVVVQLNGASTTVTGVSILQAQPGIFAAVSSSGVAYGDVIASNGTYVSATNPAVRGQNYYLVGTGFGQVTPATATDYLGINGQNVNAQVIVGVSNQGVPSFEQIYQPDAIGIYVIGFTIPLTNPTGTNQPLVVGVVINGQTLFSNTVYLPAVQ